MNSADWAPRKRTPADGAATIYENSSSWRHIKFELLESSQRHGLNPSVLRFARFGEPIFNGIGSLQRLASVVFSVIFFPAFLT